MTIEFYKTHTTLSPYIHMLWYWEDYAPPHPKERILPSGLMELTINLLGHPFEVQSPSMSSIVKSPMILVGFQSEYFVIDTSRPTTILSALFKPGSAFRFFGLSARELHNQIIPLQDIWGAKADNLYNQLMETPSIEWRFQLLEQFLLNHLDEQYERHYAVNTALDMMTVGHHTYNISEIQKEVALSPPRFIQVFRDDIGVSPKIFSRLHRFRRAVDTISSQRYTNWTDIALQCGYYDQSHFINDFQSFAGITPSAYLPQDDSHNLNIPYIE